MSRTLADLIAEVSDQGIGDYIQGTLTAAASATSLTDSLLTAPAGHYTGGNLALTSGAIQAERRVTAHAANGVFTTNGFSGTPAVGVTYELRKRTEHSRDSVKRLIQMAARELRRISWVWLDSRDAAIADTTIYEVGRSSYGIPASFEYVHRILYLNTDDAVGQGETSADRPTNAATGDTFYQADTQLVYEWTGVTWVESTRVGWYEVDYDAWTSNTDGRIIMNRNDLDIVDDIPDEAPLRFMGSRRPSIPTLDADVIDYEGNYLFTYATGRMCLKLSSNGGDPEYAAKWREFYRIEPDSLRGSKRLLPTGARRVRVPTTIGD